MRRALAVAAAAAILSTLAATSAGAFADDNRGRQLFLRRCGGCHAADRDKEGPRLAGVYGRRAGTVPGFEYSGALATSHIVWDAESLDKWLTDPDRLVPGNAMPFRIENASEREEIIRYLRQLPGR